MTEEVETTCKMERDQLLGLLDAVSACGRQRVTSEMPTATLHDLLDPAPAGPGESAVADAVSCFHRRLFVVAISFAATLLVGIATGRLLL